MSSGRSKPRLATFLASSSPVSSKLMKTPRSPKSLAPRTMNSMARSVLPHPALPQTSVGRPRGRPPSVISSSPRIPVLHFGICSKRLGVAGLRGPAAFFPDIIPPDSPGRPPDIHTMEKGVSLQPQLRRPASPLRQDEQPALAGLDADRIARLELRRVLELVNGRGAKDGLLRVDPQLLPIDREPDVDRVLGPAGQGDEDRGPVPFPVAAPDVARRQDIAVPGLDRGLFDPPADHLAFGDAEIVPDFPERPRVPGPGKAGRHAENHSPPGIAAILEHLAHQSEGNARRLDEPVVRAAAVVVEIFAEPEAVEEGEVLEIEVGGRGEAVADVVLVGAVEVDESPGPVPVEDLADALHGRPVESDVVEIEAVDADVPGQPIEPFDIVIVPARHAAVDERRVLELGHEPGGDVVAPQVLLEPGIAAAGPRREDLVTQAAQREKLGRVVGKLADG